MCGVGAGGTGGGILGGPRVLGNALSPSGGAGRQVSVVPLGSSGSCPVLLPARCFLQLVGESPRVFPSEHLLFLSEQGGMKQRFRIL